MSKSTEIVDANSLDHMYFSRPVGCQLTKHQPNFGWRVNRQPLFSWRSGVLKDTWYCTTPLCVKNCPCQFSYKQGETSWHTCMTLPHFYPQTMLDPWKTPYHGREWGGKGVVVGGVINIEMTRSGLKVHLRRERIPKELFSFLCEEAGNWDYLCSNLSHSCPTVHTHHCAVRTHLKRAPTNRP